MFVKRIMACLALMPLVGAAAPPVRLLPSSPWNLDYGDNSCRILRDFGPKGSEATLMLESLGPDEMSMVVVGGVLRASSAGDDIKATFLPERRKALVGTAQIAREGSRGAALWSRVDFGPESEKKDLAAIQKEYVKREPIDLQKRARDLVARALFAENTTELAIEVNPRRSMTLVTGSLGKVMAMYDECERDLLRQIGLDPSEQARIVKRPQMPIMASWISSNDYPVAMLVQGLQSEVRTRVVVDASGKVTKCIALSHFDAPDFNKTVCDALTKRAKFEPAELGDGTRVASYYTVHITFKMPGGR